MRNSTLNSLSLAAVRARSRFDNSFATAKTLPPLAPGYGTNSLRLRGSLGRNDATDFFQISLLPGASVSGIAFGGTVRKAPLQFSGFLEIGGNRQPAADERIPVSTTPPQLAPINPPLVNSTGSPIKFYFRLNRIGNRAATYSVRVNFFQ